ncbi:Aminoglycoside phosphotransferase [Beauveria brongniartii RCEF 3172]|uniref:Aminoglycoside phosphotransferase n=1 Tax=Beauveria brongniartii RCEF 3172 TaxID=1081107 RepID=A0A167K5C1_9HYPO|nr:Aminoglycoside phosphotransferase [Beauveria brongniartii RCEF 3172]
MTTRDLLSGPITLSAAKLKGSNVLHALRFPLQKREFYARIERQRHLLSHLVAHHLNTDLTNVRPQYVMIRFPLPYRVGEATNPGNSDEKIRTEAATYAWIHQNCPDVPIPRLYGFGLSTKQQFTHMNHLPWWSRWFQHARRFVLAALRLEQPSQLVPHHSADLADLDVGYLLMQTIESGKMLSLSWDDKYKDTRLQDNLQRDVARVMLSLASASRPLPCVGTFRVDNRGYLRLDNRPLSIQSTIQENEGIPVNSHRRRIFTSVKDFVLHHIDAFSNRLLHQPNGIESRGVAHTQMASLAGATALFPQLFRREFNNGPFVFALTDLHRSNILVDDEWNIVCIIDLEFACSWPAEFVQPPFWLGGEAMDEVTITSFAALHEGFIGHIEHEEALLPSTRRGQEPLSAIMRQGWKLGTFWITLAVMHSIAFTEIFYDRMLCDFMGATREEMDKVDYTFFARFWRKDIDHIIDKKLRDRDEYHEQLNVFFVDETN